MTKLPPALLLAALLGLSQCQKKNDPDPAAQLPPATQTGANTVGCLLNGQPWAPVGNGTSKNFQVDYDAGYPGGLFSMSAYRYQGEAPTDGQTITIYVRPMPQASTYDLSNLTQTAIGFINHRTGCDYDSRAGANYCKGTLTITRLDLQAGIIAGTFAFTLAKPGCDTIKVTQGRFDKKL